MGLEGIFSRNDKIIHAPVGPEQLVMLSVDAGRYYSVNAVGRRVWELLEEPKSIAELRAAICAEFDVDEAVCEADVVKFIGEMIKNGMVYAAGA